jgi:hypothetical protein
MKRILVIATIILCPLIFKSGNMDLIELRNLYYKASTNKEDAEKFHKAILNITGIDKHTLSGYSGMAWMIKANHSFNPYSKLSFFFKGKALLDDAILADPTNIELHFLRYCVQTNAPGFLAYNGNISTDKNIILSAYSYISDKDLKKRIKEYMQNSSHCTTAEKKLLD